METGFPKKIENPGEVYIYDNVTVFRYLDDDISVSHFISDGLTLGNIATTDASYVTVIVEAPLHGEVYRYGNHGKYWEQIGTVCGYA